MSDTLPRADLWRLYRWSDEGPAVSPRLEAHLRARFPTAQPWPRPDGESVVPAPTDGAFVQNLERQFGDAVRTDAHARAKVAQGLSLDDLVRARLGALASVPDVVVEPADEAQLARLLALCAEAAMPLVPRGGGTSVTGAVNAPSRSVVVDLGARLKGCDPVRRDDGLLTARAGTYGPELEAAANAAGYTVGHFPQSFERSTLGGWIAARSAGQMSSHYGRAEELVAGLRAVTPSGTIVVEPRPGAAVGPDLVQLLAGSEGALAIITEATVRLHPVAGKRFMNAWLMPGFAAGLEAARALARDGLPPGVVRLSDEAETARLLAMAHLPPGGAAILDFVTRRRGAALMMVVAEGPAGHVDWLRGRVRREALRARAVPLGGGPARQWWRTRFSQPALRDVLLDRGILVDTLETAAPWGVAAAVHDEVLAALAAVGADAGAHVSHVYPDGCSLYFTFLMAAAPAEALARTAAARAAVMAVLRARGCPLSHHHGTGRLLGPFVEERLGATAMGGFRALKRAWDPGGLLNPGLPWGPQEPVRSPSVPPSRG